VVAGRARHGGGPRLALLLRLDVVGVEGVRGGLLLGREEGRSPGGAHGGVLSGAAGR
jgi:hypothetical protein